MTEVALLKVWWQILLLAVAAYFIGNINFAVIISKIKKQDIRSVGSGNPGTLNMSRNFGMKIGGLTLALDILKGVLPTLAASLIFKNKVFAGTQFDVSMLAKSACGLFVITGHIFPVFMRFKGGKGIATTIGVFLVFSPVTVAISGVAAIIFIMLTEIGSMGSFIATTPGAIAACKQIFDLYIKGDKGSAQNAILAAVCNILIILIIVLTWYAHRKNIKRLLADKEHPTGWLQSIKEARIRRKLKKRAEESGALDKISDSALDKVGEREKSDGESETR